MLTAFSIVYLYVITLFIIFRAVEEPDNQYSQLKIESNLGNGMLINIEIGTQTVNPRVKLMAQSKDTIVSGFEIRLALVDMIADAGLFGDICNLAYRRSRAGTL